VKEIGGFLKKVVQFVSSKRHQPSGMPNGTVGTGGAPWPRECNGWRTNRMANKKLPRYLRPCSFIIVSVASLMALGQILVQSILAENVSRIDDSADAVLQGTFA
jgi:hypothetical protein